MVTCNFTDEQLDWLNPYVAEYLDHKTNKTNGESGRQFAFRIGKDFVKKWATLAKNPQLPSEKIVDAIHHWFKNQRSAPAAIPLFPLRKPPATNPSRLFANSDPSFKIEFDKQKEGLSTSDNLRIYNVIRKKMWAELSEEQRAMWTERAKTERGDDPDISGEKMTSDPQVIENSVEQILRNYSQRSGFSFFLCATGPPMNDGDSPTSFRLEQGPFDGITHFGEFHPNFRESVIEPWRRFAEHVHEERLIHERLQNLVKLDDAGYPLLPLKDADWSIMKGSLILTAYLDQLWFKLHNDDKKQSRIPWDALERNPSTFCNVESLPDTLKSLRRPSKMEANQVIALDQLCANLATKPPSQRFPFIISHKNSESPKKHLNPIEKRQQALIAIRARRLELNLSETENPGENDGEESIPTFIPSEASIPVEMTSQPDFAFNGVIPPLSPTAPLPETVTPHESSIEPTEVLLPAVLLPSVVPNTPKRRVNPDLTNEADHSPETASPQAESAPSKRRRLNSTNATNRPIELPSLRPIRNRKPPSHVPRVITGPSGHEFGNEENIGTVNDDPEPVPPVMSGKKRGRKPKKKGKMPASANT